MNENKAINGVGWLFAIYGWILYLPLLFYALSNTEWVGTSFGSFYKTMLLFLIVSTMLTLLIHLIIKNIKTATKKAVNRILKERSGLLNEE